MQRAPSVIKVQTEVLLLSNTNTNTNVNTNTNTKHSRTWTWWRTKSAQHDQSAERERRGGEGEGGTFGGDTSGQSQSYLIITCVGSPLPCITGTILCSHLDENRKYIYDMKWIKWWQSSEMKYILLGSPYGPLGFSGYSYGYGLNAQPLYAFLPLYSAIKWNVHTFRILIARHVKLILIAQSCFQARTQKVLSRFADRHPGD